jgi:hypothetical protein
MSKLCLITVLGGGDEGGGGIPEPSHPIVLPGDEPSHPIVIPPPPEAGIGHPSHPIAGVPGGERPTHPIAPGGERPTHPIAPGGGGERPSHPIYLPILDPGEPTHPIVLPPVEPGKPTHPIAPPPPDVPLFVLRWSAVYGWVLVPVGAKPPAGPGAPVSPKR